VNRCLSDRTLMRVLAERATDNDRAHLAVCPVCTDALQRLNREMGVIRHVLATTTEPLTRPAPRGRRWFVPAAATLAAVAAGALLWTEVVLWKGLPSPLTPSPADEAQAEQISTALASVSAELFSVKVELAPELSESPALAPPAGDDSDTGCDGTGDPAAMGCPDLLGVVEAPDWVTAAVDLGFADSRDGDDLGDMADLPDSAEP